MCEPTKLNDALSGPEPLKLTLLVVKRPVGPDRNHAPDPQSIRPVGYCPVSGRFGLDRSSNVTVRGPATTGVDVRVAVGAGVLVDVGAGVRVEVGSAVGVRVKVRTGVLVAA